MGLQSKMRKGERERGRERKGKETGARTALNAILSEMGETFLLNERMNEMLRNERIINTYQAKSLICIWMGITGVGNLLFFFLSSFEDLKEKRKKNNEQNILSITA